MGHLDEGLQQLSSEIRASWPNTVIYYIGDKNHSTNPRVSQHAPDDGKSGGAGDTPGEYDGIDVMPGTKPGQPSMGDLKRIFLNLKEAKDSRLFYMIIQDRIVSSVTRPWVEREHKGQYHTHLHVSVNDRFKANRADWKWEEDVSRTLIYKQMNGSMPELQIGDEDSEFDGFNHVIRAQALINALERSLPALDAYGVYGTKTAQKLARLQQSRETKTTKNGSLIHEPEWRTLMGFV